MILMNDFGRRNSPPLPTERWATFCQMQTFSGLFDAYPDAAHAVGALRAAGIPPQQISIVGAYNDNDEQIGVVASHKDETGAFLWSTVAGTGLGAAIGLLAGLAAFGAVGIAIGVAFVCAAWGGFAGALFETLADFHRKPGAAQGVILVMARVNESQADTVQAVLGVTSNSASHQTGVQMRGAGYPSVRRNSSQTSSMKSTSGQLLFQRLIDLERCRSSFRGKGAKTWL
jgi:hypothetical protein